MLELQADVAMMRGGSTEPMATLEFHHNDDRIKEDTKRERASVLAAFVVEALKVEINRYHIVTRCVTERTVPYYITFPNAFAHSCERFGKVKVPILSPI